jgi:hypothetical protein
MKNLGILLLCFALVALSSRAESAMDNRIAKVLQWLPEDATSISVVNGPFDFDLNAQPVSDIWGAPAPTFQHWAIFPGLSWELSSSFKKRLQLSVSCLMKYRAKSDNSDGQWRTLSEKWIELAPNPNCKFFFLSPDTVDDREIRQNIFGDDEKSNFTDHGQLVREVKVQEQPIGEICIPRPNLIIFTTDRSLMHQVLKRFSDKNSKRLALPASLPEWHEVNTDAPIWGLRHVFCGESKTSYSDPSCISLASSDLDKKALAIAYDYNKSKKTVTISYLSTNARIREAARRVLKLDDRDYFDEWELKHSVVLQTKPQVIRITVPDEPPKMHNASTAVLDWLFGHCLLGA